MQSQKQTTNAATPNYSEGEIAIADASEELAWHVVWEDGFRAGWRRFDTYAEYVDWESQLEPHYGTSRPVLVNKERQRPWIY